MAASMQTLGDHPIAAGAAFDGACHAADRGDADGGTFVDFAIRHVRQQQRNHAPPVHRDLVTGSERRFTGCLDTIVKLIV